MVRPTHRRGFSLIEVMLAVILIGVSISALLVANGSFTMANGAGADMSTAEFLIEQIREMTSLLPAVDADSPNNFGPEETLLANYDDVDDFNDITFSPPIGADRVAMNDFSAFSQHVEVKKVDPSNLETVLADTAASDFYRVTVTVSLNQTDMGSASWIRARY